VASGATTEPIGGGTVDTKGTHRRRRLAPAVPGVLTVIVMILVVLAAGFTGEFSAEPVLNPTAAAGDEERTPTATATELPEPLAEDGERLEVSGDVVIAMVLVLAIAALALLVRFLLRFRRREPGLGPPVEQVDLQQSGTLWLVEDALPVWTETSRTSFDDATDTTDAVIRCWLELERLCARAGAGRRPTQTTTDFASAVSRQLGLPAEPLTILNGLYQRARFGRRHTEHPSDPLGATDRAAAAASVDALSAALVSRRRAGQGRG
jgi:hypothetical protein